MKLAILLSVIVLTAIILYLGSIKTTTVYRKITSYSANAYKNYSKKEVFELEKKGIGGDSEASFVLYEYFYSKDDSDSVEALFWLEKAADQANVIAEFNLANFYLGKGDKKQAKYWLEKAAAAGDIDAYKMLVKLKS